MTVVPSGAEQDVTASLQTDVAQAGRERSQHADLLLRMSHTDLFESWS